jgi:hypothetical protein
MVLLLLKSPLFFKFGFFTLDLFKLLLNGLKQTTFVKQIFIGILKEPKQK